jgi:hypothetical protein
MSEEVQEEKFPYLEKTRERFKSKFQKDLTENLWEKIAICKSNLGNSKVEEYANKLDRTFESGTPWARYS